MSLKTGIVGCGKVGDFHAKAYSQLGSSAFAAVCDADIDRARAFAERYHVRAYADVAEMIQTEGLDMVSNSQNPALYGKVHIFGENGAGVGVQTDGGAMFIAGMSAIAEPPCNDLWTVPGEADLLEGWKQADCDFFNRVDSMYYYHREQIADFLRAVETHTRPLVDARDGRRTVELFTAIYRSTQTNEVIRFPLT